MAHQGDAHEAGANDDLGHRRRANTATFIYPVRSLLSGIQRPTLSTTKTSVHSVPTLRDDVQPEESSDGERNQSKLGKIIGDAMAEGAPSHTDLLHVLFLCT